MKAVGHASFSLPFFSGVQLGDITTPFCFLVTHVHSVFYLYYTFSYFLVPHGSSSPLTKSTITVFAPLSALGTFKKGGNWDARLEPSLSMTMKYHRVILLLFIDLHLLNKINSYYNYSLGGPIDV